MGVDETFQQKSSTIFLQIQYETLTKIESTITYFRNRIIRITSGPINFIYSTLNEKLYDNFFPNQPHVYH